MGINNITALKKIVATQETAPLDDVVQAINIKLNLAVEADNEATHHRLDAARMLVDPRRRVEVEGHDWWQWQKGKFARSRKDIEKLLRIGGADDPEAAAEKEKADARERMKRSRGANKRDVRSNPEPQERPIISAPLFGEVDHGIAVKGERWQQSLQNMAREAISLQPYWTKEFGDA